jgi:hypothetical protein
MPEEGETDKSHQMEGGIGPCGNEFIERLFADISGFTGSETHDTGGPRLVVDQGHFTKDFPFIQFAQKNFIAHL